MAKKTVTQTKEDRSRLDIVRRIQEDFAERKIKRRTHELQWQLNLDFYSGRQNSFLTSFDTIAQGSRRFHWQQSESFNHIAPIIESRLARLANDRIDFAVLPQTDDPGDVNAAKLCEKVLKTALGKTGFEQIVEQAAMWSEVTGTAFYKVWWDNDAGKTLGVLRAGEREESVKEGNIKISVCSPFEIFPDNIHAADINDCKSIIHAKQVSAAIIRETWDIDMSALGDEVTIIERYEAPTGRHPQGRLTIVAGDKLLHDDVLPFINQKDGVRGFPFVRQTSEQFVGNFYGRSVIERAIPVQRAYNAVKNRKVEFLNRLACGVVAVEEGSVDLDSLEADGLAPGKVIVYRQGMNPPAWLNSGTFPAELEREEERLLREFETVTGAGDIARSAEGGNTSGVALAILSESDTRRMSRTIAAANRAKIDVACMTLRLFRQFVTHARLERLVRDEGVEMFTFTAENITSDEVILKRGETTI